MWTPASWYEEARQYANRRAADCRAYADNYLALYERELPDLSRTEIAELLRASNQRRLADVPDLMRYPELRGMRELVEADWRGTRDGAELSDDQSAAYSDANFYFHRHVCRSPARSLGCSYVFFPESDHGPILANNLDSCPQEPHGMPTWPAISEHLIWGGVSSGIYEDEESPETFPAPVPRIVARYCRSTDEAVAMLERYNHFWGPGNVLLIDRNKDVAIVEKSACRMGVRRSSDGFAFVTAMTATEPSMKAFLAGRRAASLKSRNLPEDCADTAYWNGADRRHLLMEELLEEAKGDPTLDRLRRIIQFRDPERGRVCYNGDILFPGGPPCEYTLRTTIWLLREGRAMWWAKEGDTPSFENRQANTSYPDAWTWD